MYLESFFILCENVNNNLLIFTQNLIQNMIFEKIKHFYSSFIFIIHIHKNLILQFNNFTECSLNFRKNSLV